MPTRSSAVQRETDAIAQIPRSCVCTWSWSTHRKLWVKTRAEQNCPWHKVVNPI